MAPAIQQAKRRIAVPRSWIITAVLIAVVAIVGATYSFWLPTVQNLLSSLRGPGDSSPASADADSKEEEHDDHGHKGHGEGSSIELSEQARKNIGLKLQEVELSKFIRTFTVPGIVVERPGRSRFDVTAPLTGIVTVIFATEGVAVEEGQELFEIRLTHEEVVQAQADMLRTVEELAVNQREVERLEKATAGGAAGKTLLERQYEQQKLQAVLRSQRQTLLLHGFSQEQVDRIEKDRSLLQTFTVQAPKIRMSGGEEPKSKSLQLETLKVTQGQHVNAGDTLATLTDYTELFIEGNAFERDAEEVQRAAAEKWPVTAYIQAEDEKPEFIRDLRILYVSTQIDVNTRTLHFYVRLPNEQLGVSTTPEGNRFVAWHHRPGQRMQLQVPVETLDDRIVLPIDAIAQEGPETYVFTVNGDHFDRRPVHVEFRDSTQAVIENDGAIFPGDTVAVSGAQQLQLALKNKAGGGIDPHAGHNH